MSDRRLVPYVLLDVFTSTPYAGNPLAVVMDSEGLTGEQMLRITREFNLSETVFPLPPTAEERAAGAHYSVRIFTPGSEVPFAGHPSVGTAWWLCHTGQIPGGLVGQKCGVGVLPIEVSASGAAVTAGPATVSEPVDPSLALAAVGLDASDLVDTDVRIASTGLEYYVLLVTPEAVDRCRPDLSLLSGELADPSPGKGVYVVAFDRDRLGGRARMFSGDMGQAEDAATGSAALAFGAMLVARGMFPDGAHTVVLTQGVEMGRPSRLTLTCAVRGGEIESLQVAGDVVKVGEGVIAVPDA